MYDNQEDFKIEVELMLFAYIGPETFLPVASVLAALAGMVMMLGRSSLQVAARCFRFVTLQGRRDRLNRRP